MDEARTTQVARQLVGDPRLEIELISANTWTVNNMYATRMQAGRVVIMGDVAHRHPPSNRLGSNTSIQDGFKLAWKLATVCKGQAGPALLDRCDAERAPIARQIVTRTSQSIGEFGPISRALGMVEGVDHAKFDRSMAALGFPGETAEAGRDALRRALALRAYEFDADGVEMNRRHNSSAIVTDGQPEPPFAKAPELHVQLSTWPGSRLPHA